MDHTLDSILSTKRVLVCCGSGGVGKTTLSAALALAAARRGRKVLVATVDPARRLADALGVDALRDEESRVPAKLPAGGELWAAMLDTKRTFDRMVARHADSPESARRILDNRIYRAISVSVAGTHEFMAMERLHELHAKGRYDLVVLDTPPTTNALDFLSAPDRMLSVLSSGVIRLFASISRGGERWGLGLLRRGGALVMAAVKKVVGGEFIDETAEFFRIFEGYYAGFEDRSKAVQALLASPETSFVLVTAPADHTLDEARFLAKQLDDMKLPLAAVLVNRMHVLPEGSPDLEGRASALAELVKRGDAAGATPADQALADLAESFRWAGVAARGDRRRLESLSESIRVSVREVPLQPHEVHDVAGLAALGNSLGVGMRIPG